MKESAEEPAEANSLAGLYSELDRSTLLKRVRIGLKRGRDFLSVRLERLEADSVCVKALSGYAWQIYISYTLTNNASTVVDKATKDCTGCQSLVEIGVESHVPISEGETRRGQSSVCDRTCRTTFSGLE